jgi:hypothetical protein
MVSYIIISLAATFALYRLFVVNGLWSRILSAALIVAIAQIVLPIEGFQTAGFLLYICAIAAVLICAIVGGEMEQKKRLLLVMVAVPLLTVHVFKLGHWPHAGYITLGLLIPIVASVALFIDYKKNRVDLGFLTILVADAAIQFQITAQATLTST